MSSNNNTNIKMSDRLFNHLFPIGGGSLGAVGSITWHGAGDMALQAAIFALVGGIIGWTVKFTLDKIVKKK